MIRSYSPQERNWLFYNVCVVVYGGWMGEQQVFNQGKCPSKGNTCGDLLKDKTATSYWGYIRESIAGSLASLVVNGTKAHQDGVFAPACLEHCMPSWQGNQVRGRNDQQAFGDWFFRRGKQDMSLDMTADPTHLCACAKG